MKIEETIKRFLEYLKRELNYSDQTIENYNRDLSFYASYLNKKNINYLTIKKDSIINYLKYLDNLKYSNKSISRILSSLRSFYNYLVNIKFYS